MLSILAIDIYRYVSNGNANKSLEGMFVSFP